MTDELKNISRLSLHTSTTKPWSLPEAVEGYVRAEIPGISIARQHLDACGAKEAAKLLKDSKEEKAA